MSSLKMTFSLTSLIFLIALGLVFAPTAVMAHDAPGQHPAQTGTTEDPGTHAHDNADGSQDAIADDATTTGVDEEVPAHNSHPMVESIVLKGGNTRGTMAAVTADVISTADVKENQFTLVIKFDQPVVSAADVRTLATDSDDPTATPIVLRDPLVGAAATDVTPAIGAAVGEFTVSVVNGDSTTANADTRIAMGAATSPFAVTRTGTAGDTFEAVVTLTDNGTTGDPFPSGIMGADTRIFKVQVNANAVYSLETTPTNVIGEVTGSGSTASDVYAFTLVKTLPAPDTAGPVATIAPPAALVGGMANFEISFDKALGTDKLMADDFMITGQRGTITTHPLSGTLTLVADDDDADDLPSWTLAVTPYHSRFGFVKVVMKTDAVNDALGNKSSEASAIFILEDKEWPQVDIWVGSTTTERVYGEHVGRHTIVRGKAEFTLAFSEPMQKSPNTVSRLEASDFTITQYMAGKDGKVDLDSGKVITVTADALEDISDDNGVAWTTDLNPDIDVEERKQRDFYRLSVPATDMFNQGGQHIKIELRVAEATDPSGNTVGTWLEGFDEADLRDVNPHATFDTISPVVAITPGYVEDDRVKPTDTLRDDTFVALTANTDGLYIGKSRENIAFLFDFSEQLRPDFSTDDLDSAGLSNGRYIRDSKPYAVDKDGEPLTGYVPRDHPYWVVVVETVDKNKSSTILMRRRSIWDVAGNFLQEDVDATYTVRGDVTPPVVALPEIAYLNCDIGNHITFDLSDPAADPKNPNKEPLPSGLPASTTDEGSVSPHNKDGTPNEVTVSKGWKIVFEPVRNGVTRTGEYWLVPIGDGSEHGVTTVTVTVKAGAVKDNAGNESGQEVETYTVGPVLTIPAGGYTVVLRTEHDPMTATGELSSHLGDPLYVGSLGVRGQFIDVQPWDCMPDLTVFFGRKASPRPGIGGGAIVVKESPEHDKDDKKPPIAEGTVGISEIMWSSDEGLPHGGVPITGYSNLNQTREQWIELHNLNIFPVTVTLFAYPDEHAVRMAQTDKANEIDRMSNYEIGNSWPLEGKGQSGNSAYGTDFIAMQRPTPASDKSYKDVDGKNKDNWKKSEHIYLTRKAGLANTGRIPVEDLTYDFIGTPGRSNTLTVFTPTLKTVIAESPVIFNEIANRSNANRYYEWIELRNVTDAEVNLREYRLSVVTGVDTETELYTFPDNDNIKIPAKGLLLLVDTDPQNKEDHPIAMDNPEVRGRYVVTDFKGNGLPDSGEFVLILRENNGDKPAALKTAPNDLADGKPKAGKGHIIDIAGYHPNLAALGNPLYTSLWPLKVFPAPNLGHNKLEVETVHRRQHVIDGTTTVKDGNHVDQTAFRDAGYSGIGYKRLIPDLPAHGGTPGYDNGVAKEYNDSAVNMSAAPVTISEIMYQTGNRLPQWIELYNSSLTEVVKLEDWTLQLENDADDEDVSIRTPWVSVKIAAKLIQPNQTVLIVASTTGNRSDHFPNARIIDLFTNGLKDKDRLERDTENRRNFQFLSQTAFKITLKDKAGKVVDVAGNYDRAGAAWELPQLNDDGTRSSIIRRYDKDSMGKVTIRDGMLPVWSGDGMLKPAKNPADAGMAGDAGWVLASASALIEAQEATYYGNVNDMGTPGYKGGGPVPVSLSKFRPERLKDTGEIVIRWITESELNNAGFNILRSETRNGEFTKINTSLIAGQGTTSERTTYEWKDSTAKPNVVYYYQIQDISLDGKVTTLRQSRLKGNVTAAGKATTTWGEIKALQ